MINWHERFIHLASHIAGWSKDPSTQVGAVVTDNDRRIVTTGFNGFPRGVADDERLHNREEKYPIICHAEENALMQAARTGVQVHRCNMYVTMPPCVRCSRLLIQAGIRDVFFPANLEIPDRWINEILKSLGLLREAGVNVHEVTMSSVYGQES